MTLAELVAQLEVAVRGRDRGRARELEQEFLQRVATEAADRAGLERRVRALMGNWISPPPGRTPFASSATWAAIQRGRRRRLSRHQPQGGGAE